jgi:hypothetical protein
MAMCWGMKAAKAAAPRASGADPPPAARAARVDRQDHPAPIRAEARRRASRLPPVSE